MVNTAVRGRLHFSNFTETSIFTRWANGLARLQGVYGTRHTLVFTLQVGATPFHQGVLAMNWQYNATTSDSDKFIRSVRSETCTNLPHVRMDLSTDTMVQLKVPFLAPGEFTKVGATATTAPYGVLAINSILPVPTVAGISAPSYTLLMHIEDLELFGAVPQSSSGVALQSGKKLSPVTEEFEQEAYPFSSSAMALSRSVKWVGKGIPALSSISGPTSWFLEKAAGAIRSFGFARPQICDPVQRMVRYDTICENNVDLANSGVVLGPISQNTLAVSPMFGGTDVDEMSLAYLCSQYSQITTFPIATTEAAGTLKYVTPVSPSTMWFRISSGNPYCNVPPPVIAPTSTNAFQPSGLFFFGQMFKVWRGGLKFRFTFSKTKMHGGRVMLVYRPDENNYSESVFGTRPTLSVADYGASGPDPFGYSTILNLRDGNVFEFEVPYISSFPYTPFSSFTGTLAMYIVDPLQAPAVVSSTINVLVEVKAGSDFEFAIPRTPLYPAHVGGTITLQSAKRLATSAETLSQHTVGESINSVKQLISIPKVTFANVTSASGLATTIPPWFYQPRPSFLVPAPTTHITESFSFGGNIATCYAFVKGGTDYHIYDYLNIGAAISARPVSTTGTLPTVNQSPALWPPESNNPRVTNSSTGALHLRLPAYQGAVRLPASVLNGVASTGSSWGPNGFNNPSTPFNRFGPMTMYRVTIASSNNGLMQFSRAAADDAGLAHYMGPPPLLLLSTNTAGAAYDVDTGANQ